MSTLLKQVAEPQVQSIAKLPAYIRFRKNYNKCPSCGQFKHIQATKCKKCADSLAPYRKPKPRHEVIQPDDPKIRLVPLTRGFNTIVDTEHYDRVMRLLWIADKGKDGGKCWAIGFFQDPVTRDRFSLPLPNFILGLPRGAIVDHENGDGLDNRVDNLRPASHEQNMWNSKMRSDNTSGFIGINFLSKRGGWQGKVTAHGKHYYTKLSMDKVEVAKERDRLALEHHGEFASLNFPDQSNSSV